MIITAQCLRCGAYFQTVSDPTKTKVYCCEKCRKAMKS